MRKVNAAEVQELACFGGRRFTCGAEIVVKHEEYSLVITTAPLCRNNRMREHRPSFDALLSCSG